MLTTNYSFVFKLSFWVEGGGWGLCTRTFMCCSVGVDGNALSKKQQQTNNNKKQNNNNNNKRGGGGGGGVQKSKKSGSRSIWIEPFTMLATCSVSCVEGESLFQICTTFYVLEIFVNATCPQYFELWGFLICATLSTLRTIVLYVGCFLWCVLYKIWSVLYVFNNL